VARVHLARCSPTLRVRPGKHQRSGRRESDIQAQCSKPNPVFSALATARESRGRGSGSRRLTPSGGRRPAACRAEQAPGLASARVRLRGDLENGSSPRTWSLLRRRPQEPPAAARMLPPPATVTPVPRQAGAPQVIGPTAQAPQPPAQEPSLRPAVRAPQMVAPGRAQAQPRGAEMQAPETSRPAVEAASADPRRSRRLRHGSRDADRERRARPRPKVPAQRAELPRPPARPS
jgi:hypothetical protein